MFILSVFCLACIGGAIGAGLVYFSFHLISKDEPSDRRTAMTGCEVATYRNGIWFSGDGIGETFFTDLARTIKYHCDKLEPVEFPKPGETLIFESKSNAKVLLMSAIGADIILIIVPWNGKPLPPSSTDILRNMPALLWSVGPDGATRLANVEVQRVLQEANLDSTSRLFPQLPPSLPNAAPMHQRVAHQPDEGGPMSWFDVASFQQGSDVIHMATQADKHVGAERARSSVVQALTKTFAHLSVGLAVFDAQTRLILFNPSLTQMVGLPIDFLSSRPTLPAFLDQLRQEGTLPEPKDYRVWRRALIARLSDARSDTWIDTWTMPGGITYRVTGRPQTDGSIVLVVEDISAETTLTRRFRQDVELAQVAMDSATDAIAIFDNSGMLSISNRRFEELWGIEPDTLDAPTTVIDYARQWHKHCRPSPVLGDLTETLTSSEKNKNWSDTLQLKSGNFVEFTVAEVNNRYTLLRFAELERLALPAE